MHLQPDELVDIAEGMRATSSAASHLAACEVCRRQLDDLRAMLSEIASVEVPEPSPIFWDHFSERVRDTVAAEGTPRGFWYDLVSWPRLLIPASALAAAALLVIAIGVASRVAWHPAPGMGTASAEYLLNTQQMADDPFLGLVADLTGNLDADMADEAGLTGGGSADHAVAHLTDDELRELRRLLQAELANSGV